MAGSCCPLRFGTIAASDLEFRPSEASARRASELLELIRANQLDDATRDELNQFEQAELLMRLVKARIRANQGKGRPPR